MTAPTRRGMILYVVLMVVVIATLIGTGSMFVAEIRVTSAGASLKSAQAHALAWSGVQAVMAELSEQREAILRGQDPILTSEWELYNLPGGARGIVRLLPVSPKGPKFQSESAKADVNTATAEMLAKLPGMDDKAAQAIVSQRSWRPIQSIAELLAIEGMAGSFSEATPANRNTPAPVRDDAPAAPALANFVTAYSFEPCIQLGNGDQNSDQRGHRRLNVNMGFSDDLGAALEKRLGKPLATRVGGMLKAVKDLKTRADLIKAMTGAQIDSADWRRLLDLFEPGIDPYARGRIDVNRAPVEVLACLPGMDAAKASKAVDLRVGLGTEALSSPLWLLEQGLLTPEQFGQAADFVTVRSFQWRVIIEAGVTQGGEESTSKPLAETPLASRTVLEAIIDISSQRPRVAFLRDVTLEDAASELAERARQVAASEPPPEPEPAALPPATPPAPPAPPPEPPPASPSDAAAEPAPPIPTPVDRRLGRWTAGGRSGDQR